MKLARIISFIWIIIGFVLLVAVCTIGESIFTSIYAKLYLSLTPVCLLIMFIIRKIIEKSR